MRAASAIPEVSVACPLCGGRGPTFYVENGRRFERCPCGLVFQNPRPTDAWLQAARYEPYDRGAAHGREMRAIYEHAASVLPPGRLLDVGCGPGLFVRMMRSRGWDAEGIDLDRGEDFLRLDLEGPFDALTAIYVLEHVADPRRFVEKARRLLRPGGMLYVRVPHTAPIVRIGKLLAPRWNFFHTPWHLQDFPPRVLLGLLGGWTLRIDRTPTRRGAWARLPVPGRSYTVMATRPMYNAQPP
ncbi:MAG: methyltransferase domain-containing protein [Planctomycetes bacterium]|nr:methyltransferase domain-containing protein [Planctomycetota bacterium]